MQNGTSVPYIACSIINIQCKGSRITVVSWTKPNCQKSKCMPSLESLKTLHSSESAAVSDIEERYITYRQISYAICLQRKRRLLIQRLTLILNGPLALCNTLPLNHMQFMYNSRYNSQHDVYTSEDSQILEFEEVHMYTKNPVCLNYLSKL